jgi:hypothetical protein
VTVGVRIASPLATTRTARISSAGVGVFHQESGGAGPQAFEDVFVQFEGGQDDDVDRGQVRARGDAAGRLDAIDPGHPDVHQQHVRRVPFREPHGLLCVSGLADHVEVVLGVEERGESGPDEFLVVGQRDPDHRSPPSCESPCSGSRARTVKPPPGRGPA